MAVIDAMMRHRGDVPNADKLAIYNQWPGFFHLNALFLQATGLESASAMRPGPRRSSTPCCSVRCC